MAKKKRAPGPAPAPAPISVIIEKYCCNTQKATINFLSTGTYYIEVLDDPMGTLAHPDFPTAGATSVTVAVAGVQTITLNHPANADNVLVCVWTISPLVNRPTDCSGSGSCSSSESGSHAGVISRMRNPYVRKSVLP